MKILGTIAALVMLCMSPAAAQQSSSVFTMSPGIRAPEEGDVPQAIQDSLNPVRPFWVPIVEVTGLNTSLTLFNRYVANSPFARISFQTVADNFKHGFDFDADKFITNQWAHPFNGALFYNFARSTGHDYWASLTTAMFGSWQWEYFAENEPPAINDWIQTSISGAFLGEMTYRFSSLIIDESATGSERTWREIAAFVVAPTRGFNRLIYGQMFRTTPYGVYEQERMGANVTFGLDNIAPGVDLKNGSKNYSIGLEVTYGQPFRRAVNKPFDFFRMNMALNFGITKPNGYFYGYGVLTGKRVGEENNVVIGLFQHYDYLSNPVYRLGATAIGVGTLFRSSEGAFAGSAHLSGILMGAANSVYAEEFEVASLDSSRDYNFGSGAEVRVELNYQVAIVRLYAGYSFYWLHTMQGAPGDELIGILRPKVFFNIGDRWQAGLEYAFYHRQGRYHGLFPDIDLRSNEQRVFVGYRFGG